MKIIHTSDWHLGHMICNKDRHKEQESMLNQMVEIVKREQPDAFLIAGDVYDSTQPAASVQTMLSDALVEIHNACPKMAIICISGNHDSNSKHMIFHTPWKELNVSMIGNITREESNLKKYIIKVENKGFIVAVPYAADRNMPEDVFKRLFKMVEEMNEEQLPVVLMAHLAIAGCNFKGHENATEKTIGGLDCQDLEVIGKGYDYVALGHIHRAQFVKDSQERVRYCGTPIPISFDEVESGNEHSVTVVELQHHGENPVIRTINIDNPHPLVNLPSEGFAEWDEVKRLFMDYPADIPSYVRLNVLVDKYLPPMAESEAQQIAQNKQCKSCLVNSKRKEQNHDESSHQQFTTTEFQQLSPMDVAKMFLDSKGEDFDEELQSLFEEVMKTLIEDVEKQ